MDTPSFGPYVAFAKSAASHGYTRDAIYNELLQRGIAEETVGSILQEAQIVGIYTHPATSAAPSSAPAQPQTFQSPGLLAFPASLPVSNLDPPRLSGTMIGFLIAGLLCVIPSIVIIFDIPFEMRFGTTIRALLTIGDIAGVIGLCLYVIDLVLAMRLPKVEDLFGGLNKVYIAHGILGGSALIAILIHPVLIAVRYAPLGIGYVGNFFIPSFTYIASAWGVLAVALIIILLTITFFIHLPYRIWLWSHRLLGLAYAFMVIHILFEPNTITDNSFIKWYLLVFMFIGVFAFVYRTILPNIFVRRYLYMIQDVTQKATGVMQITMKPQNKIMKFQAGQFVFISFHADGLSTEWHPFTIASAPKDGSFMVDVKSLGAFTETITRLLPNMVGMTVDVEGAYGRFSFRNYKNVNQVWIAGGIGVTPFLSMAQALGSQPCNIDLYYSVRSETELIDIDVLAREQTVRPGQVFRVIPFVSDNMKQFLNVDMIQTTTGDLSKRDFLICGPPPMMKAFSKQLLAKGVKKYRIHTEDFSIL